MRGLLPRGLWPGSASAVWGRELRRHDARELPALQQLRPAARLVTSYFAVLIVCSAPRLVSTVSRSRSPTEAMNRDASSLV